MHNLKNLYIPIIIASILLSGCGGNLFEGMTDDSTEAAKMEAAKIALDTGDYPSAVSLLEELCGTDTANLTCNDTAKADLASAYVATATGLDVLQLIAKAEEAAANPTGSFTTVSTLLPIDDINACAANPSSCTIQTDLDKAIEILDSLLPDTVPPSPTSEQKNQYLQLATASAVNVAVTIGVISNGLDPVTGLPNTPPTSVSSTDLTRVSDDINNIVLGLAGADIISTSISEDINRIENAIDADGDKTVTQPELVNYINSL